MLDDEIFSRPEGVMKYKDFEVKSSFLIGLVVAVALLIAGAGVADIIEIATQCQELKP